MNLFITLFIPFVFALMSWPAVKAIGERFVLIDYPDRRKIHSIPTLKIGGFIILTGYIAGVLILKAFWFPISLSLLLVFVTGLLGDKDILGARHRLILQSAIALMFILSSGAVVKDLRLFELPVYLGIPFTIFGIAGLTNAYNIIDGMNGLCSLLGIIALLTLSILGNIYAESPVFIQSLIFIGGLTCFLLFNLRGKVFMGDAGSYMIGFMVASLSVFLAAGVKEISPFAFLLNAFIPVFDTIFSIWRRKRLGIDPFKADRRHLHHMLSRRYKSRTRALIVLVVIQAVLSTFAIVYHRETLILIILILFAALFLRRLWFKRIAIMGVRL